MCSLHTFMLQLPSPLQTIKEIRKSLNLFYRVENIVLSFTEYLLLSQGGDVCVSYESSSRVKLFR